MKRGFPPACQSAPAFKIPLTRRPRQPPAPPLPRRRRRRRSLSLSRSVMNAPEAPGAAIWRSVCRPPPAFTSSLSSSSRPPQLLHPHAPWEGGGVLRPPEAWATAAGTPPSRKPTTKTLKPENIPAPQKSQVVYWAFLFDCVPGKSFAPGSSLAAESLGTYCTPLLSKRHAVMLHFCHNQ